MTRPRFGLPRPVWLLGWVSFFTDTASEMVYPLLPLFLTRVLGAGAMSLGLIEGAAEAANSALKILSGWLSDRWQSPKKLVLGGYGLSSAARPLMAIVTAWPQVLAIRFTDRLGKGVRGAPRDAMLADFAPVGSRGTVYGFHRAMDHAGAVTGPLIAALFLYFYPNDYRTLFGLTIIPGLIVILVLLRVPEPSTPPPDTPEAPPSIPDAPSRTPEAPSRTPEAPSRTPEAPSRTQKAPFSTPQHPSAPFSTLTPAFWKAMAVIFLFTLGNASDAFLLLRLSDLGVAAFWIPLLWSALHVVKMLSSFAGGALSDRLGRRALIASGWIVYALVYAGFAVFESLPVVIVVFLSYGLYFGLTEGVEKAWVADLAPATARGTAFGIYNAALGAGALVASVVFGLIWTRVSPPAAFGTGAALAVAAAALLYSLFPHAEHPRHQR